MCTEKKYEAEYKYEAKWMKRCKWVHFEGNFCLYYHIAKGVCAAHFCNKRWCHVGGFADEVYCLVCKTRLPEGFLLMWKLVRI